MRKAAGGGVARRLHELPAGECALRARLLRSAELQAEVVAERVTG